MKREKKGPGEDEKSFVSFTTRTIPPIPSPYFSTGLLFLKKEEETKGVASAKAQKGNDEEEPIVFISSLLGHFGMMETTHWHKNRSCTYSLCVVLLVTWGEGSF